MMKLLIVDDEERVCKVVRHLVDWDELEIQIVGECRNVPEAIKSIEEMQPEIVITDIRMPGHDGIELIRQMKKLYPDIHFVIISGYSQFEYAQNAIKYGVDDYLLKPIKKKELLQSVVKIKQDVLGKQSRIYEEANLRAKALEDAEKIKKGFLRALLHGQQTQVMLENLNLVNMEYHSAFQPGKFQVLIAKPFIDYSGENLYTMRVLLEKTERLLHDQIGHRFTECIHVVHKSKIYFLLNGTEDSFQGLEKILRKVYVEVLSWKEVFGNVHLYFSLSQDGDAISCFVCGIKEAEIRLLDRMLPESGYFLGPLIRQKLQYRTERIECIKKFQNSVEALDEQGAEKCIWNLEQILYNAPDLTGFLVEECYDSLLIGFIESIQKLKLEANIEEIKSMFQEIFIYSDGIKLLFQNLNKLIRGLINQWNKLKKMEQTKPIRLARQYMQRYFKETLTLEIVSGQVGLNPTYFSNLFKIETGQNFSEYLIEIRILNAKDLLTDTDISIADVADSVGYGDVKYFSKLFKKVTGLSPAEYRKLYQ